MDPSVSVLSSEVCASYYNDKVTILSRNLARHASLATISVKPMPSVGLPSYGRGDEMPIWNGSNRRLVPGEPDGVDQILSEQLENPEFRATYEDAEARSALIQFLSRLRHERGWTQKELAKRLGTTQSAVSDFEKSVVEPRLPTLQRWARAYGFRLEFQLWKGPLVHYSSWISRKLPYEHVVQAIRADDEIAQSWFAASGLEDRAELPGKPNRVSVNTGDLTFAMHYTDPTQEDSDYWRGLTKQLGAMGQ